MLVLNRRVSESVMIGADITVTVLGVNGKQVRIGISAPKTIPVYREEIFLAIQEEERMKEEAKQGSRAPGAGASKAPRRPRRE